MKNFALAFMTVVLLSIVSSSRAADEYPPGWMPLERLSADAVWDDDDPELRGRVHLYLPSGDKPVRGVFACIVFHSGDPRELADAWNFALVTVPTAHLYDLGDRDKRNKRSELGHDPQGMGLLLRYLDAAAAETKHPELKAVPLVGWFGQGGAHFCNDLYQIAPERVLAWSDSFSGPLRSYPELTKAVPFPYAWEVNKRDLQNRERTPHKNNPPVADLACPASTYGFPHGIYSKYNFFMAYLDRCIKLRLPEEMPPPGEPVKLRPVVREEGWVGDYMPISEWNPIAPAGSTEARQFAHPAWLPDSYSAAMWRAYHSADPIIEMTEPIIPYGRSKRGPKMGLGYGGFLPVEEALTLQAESSAEYAKMEFYDGDELLGTTDTAPWSVEGIRFSPGLHAIYAVGVKADGSRTASRPAIAVAK